MLIADRVMQKGGYPSHLSYGGLPIPYPPRDEPLPLTQNPFRPLISVLLKSGILENLITLTLSHPWYLLSF
uniref:Uncharacterized protein n=1 Tax=Lepeophtheirus salmonis TaxID=72036 RepID=A0A0K2UDM5_LEPSM